MFSAVEGLAAVGHFLQWAHELSSVSFTKSVMPDSVESFLQDNGLQTNECAGSVQGAL